MWSAAGGETMPLDVAEPAQRPNDQILKIDRRRPGWTLIAKDLPNGHLYPEPAGPIRRVTASAAEVDSRSRNCAALRTP